MTKYLRREDYMYMLRIILRRYAQAPTPEEQRILEDLGSRIVLMLCGDDREVFDHGQDYIG